MAPDLWQRNCLPLLDFEAVEIRYPLDLATQLTAKKAAIVASSGD